MAEDEQNYDEEMSVEELVEENNILLNTLIDYLIEKKVIDEDEFLKKLNSVSSEVQNQGKSGEEQENSEENQESSG